MDSLRYFLAVILYLTLPQVLICWLLIHPFVRLWRRMGPAAAYSIVAAAVALCGTGLFLVRRPLLAVEYGTSYPLVALGVLGIAAAGWMRWLIQRRFSTSMLVGLPELQPDRHGVKLVTDGIYSRIRHPRYTQLTIAILGYALIANYLIGYALVALWIPGIYLVALLEERELRGRFGAEYDEYCRRVPRFIPRRRGTP